MKAVNTVLHSPFADILCAIAMIVIGVLLFIYRNEIGDFTGYYAGRGGFVDKPTHGWMLIPFALALIIGGVVIISRIV